MAGHDVTLVCRPQTAQLINAEGTTVRLKLKGEEAHREIRSAEMPPQLNPGRLDATPPEAADPAAYHLVSLAMQEPQSAVHAIWTSMVRVAEEQVPCLYITNQPRMPYMSPLHGLDPAQHEATGRE